MVPNNSRAFRKSGTGGGKSARATGPGRGRLRLAPVYGSPRTAVPARSRSAASGPSTAPGLEEGGGGRARSSWGAAWEAPNPCETRPAHSRFGRHFGGTAGRIPQRQAPPLMAPPAWQRAGPAAAWGFFLLGKTSLPARSGDERPGWATSLRTPILGPDPDPVEGRGLESPPLGRPLQRLRTPAATTGASLGGVGGVTWPTSSCTSEQRPVEQRPSPLRNSRWLTRRRLGSAHLQEAAPLYASFCRAPSGIHLQRHSPSASSCSARAGGSYGNVHLWHPGSVERDRRALEVHVPQSSPSGAEADGFLVLPVRAEGAPGGGQSYSIPLRCGALGQRGC